VAELGADEVRVLLTLAKRLAMGQRCYGALDLAHDVRDWRRECLEELVDAAIYRAIAEVASTHAQRHAPIDGTAAPLAEREEMPDTETTTPRGRQR
jgi:hypothetical protein